MKVKRQDGSEVEVSEDVVKLIQASSKGSTGGNRADPKALSEKYPWAGPFIALHGLFLKENGKGGFKQATKVTCQAGNSKVLTTSKFRGIDSRTPDRVAADGSGTGPAKVARLVNYDYSSLPKCTEEFTVATSDLFQTHLCKSCRVEIKGHASQLKRDILAQQLKAAQAPAAISEEGSADAEDAEEAGIAEDDLNDTGEEALEEAEEEAPEA